MLFFNLFFLLLFFIWKCVYPNGVLGFLNIKYVAQLVKCYQSTENNLWKQKTVCPQLSYIIQIAKIWFVQQSELWMLLKIVTTTWKMRFVEHSQLLKIITTKWNICFVLQSQALHPCNIIIATCKYFLQTKFAAISAVAYYHNSVQSASLKPIVATYLLRPIITVCNCANCTDGNHGAVQNHYN